jgi:hypothetical protein
MKLKVLIFVLNFVFLISCQSQSSTFQIDNLGREIDYDFPSEFFLESISPQDVALATQKSRLTLVYLWTTWCMPSKGNIDGVIMPLIESFSDKSISVLLIAASTDTAAVKAILEKKRFPIQAYHINDQKLTGGLFDKNSIKKFVTELASLSSQRVKVPSQSPYIFLLDSNGVVVEFDVPNGKESIFSSVEGNLF